MIYKPQSENFKEVQLLCKNFVKVLKISGVFCKNNEPTEPDSVPEPDEEGEAPKTGDSNMAMMYILLLGSSAGIAGITALMRKKCKN